MKVALGFHAHSGWASLVVVGRRGSEIVIASRRRVELVDDVCDKQPYHAAEHLAPQEARDAVARSIANAQAIAIREFRAAIAHEQARNNAVAACAVLVGSPMPAWTVDEILAVHFRMHTAEGVLFRDVLIRASRHCGIPSVEIPAKTLLSHAAKVLATPAARLKTQVAALGKAAGPPWGKDQKDAALAALVALRGTAS